MASGSTRVIKRMCTVCRALKDRTELIRLVKPTGAVQIIPNPDGSISGKGFYICRQADCLNKLQKDKRLRKNFSTKLTPETTAWLQEQLNSESAETAEISPTSCDEEVKDL
ncbi:YlxR family protein [bacterium]|nr:YlxR family protein [bacterium]